MATPTRQLARVAMRASLTNTSRTTIQRTRRRLYSSQGGTPPPPPKSSSTRWMWLAGLGAATAGAGALLYAQKNKPSPLSTTFAPQFRDYQAVYNEIAGRLEEKDDYDDGSYAPVLLRLAWHCSGTYDKETGTGGSNGATMRFAPESGHGANAGLEAARTFLEPVKARFPWISYSDLWILGGVCAVQEMLGPNIPYRPGRSDKDMAACTPDGRLPDGAKGPSHVRDIFTRMGFDDREIVALIGAHAVGRCHANRSGFDGPWTFSPTVITNDFYRLLLESKWEWKKWSGPKQYEDKETHSLMMLPADMALVQDKKFKQLVQAYAADNDLWFKDFSAVLVKLFELGVPFAEGTEGQRWVFKKLDE